MHNKTTKQFNRLYITQLESKSPHSYQLVHKVRYLDLSVYIMKISRCRISNRRPGANIGPGTTLPQVFYHIWLSLPQVTYPKPQLSHCIGTATVPYYSSLPQRYIALLRTCTNWPQPSTTFPQFHDTFPALHAALSKMMPFCPNLIPPTIPTFLFHIASTYALMKCQIVLGIKTPYHLLLN